MHSVRSIAASLACLGALVVACGSNTGNGGLFVSELPDAGGPGNTAEAGTTPGVGLGTGVCTPACSGTERCSVTNTCIPQGTCVSNGDCSGGLVCDLGTKTCKPGGECGSVKIAASPVAPNLMMVLDRSCSMTGAVQGTQNNKWQIAVASIGKLTTDYKGQFRFGITLFPDSAGQACLQEGPVPVPVGDAKEASIQKLLTDALVKTDANYPDGPCVTNIDTGMEQASKQAALTDKTRPSYVVLLSDGAQSNGCNSAGADNGTTGIINSMFSGGIKTFVIGFGSGSDAAQLNTFALAGGVPANDPTTKFYKAENAAALDAVLKTIATKAQSCDLSLKETPPDPSKLYVFGAGNAALPRDASHQTGWDYSAQDNRITFYGQTCEDLKSGKLTGLEVVFGCPPTESK
jgi:hypothetical protein